MHFRNVNFLMYFRWVVFRKIFNKSRKITGKSKVNTFSKKYFGSAKKTVGTVGNRKHCILKYSGLTYCRSKSSRSALLTPMIFQSNRSNSDYDLHVTVDVSHVNGTFVMSQNASFQPSALNIYFSQCNYQSHSKAPIEASINLLGFN